jgi:hypothetical protein
MGMNRTPCKFFPIDACALQKYAGSRILLRILMH